MRSLSLTGVICSFAFDYELRIRFATSAGASSINPFILRELVAAKIDHVKHAAKFVASLSMAAPIYSSEWLDLKNRLKLTEELGRYFALSNYERARCLAIINAIVFCALGLDKENVELILEDCDHPAAVVLNKKFSRHLNPKGFWRIDKDKDPELRHTVLSLIAFHDLQEKGLDAFLAQNDGEGWMIPEQLRLADYGLGHDDRAQEYQPVASRLGPRFYDWQLNEDVERSWQECAAHAELIRRIVPLPEPEPAVGVAEEQATYKTESPQGALF